MKPLIRNSIIVIIILVAVILLARYVVFKDKFEEMGEGLERIGTWQENYKREHPNATKAEMDAAFDASSDGLFQGPENGRIAFVEVGSDFRVVAIDAENQHGEIVTADGHPIDAGV